jgi:flagellar L-ring protein precursor FlgH
LSSTDALAPFRPALFLFFALIALLTLASCGRIEDVGKRPDFQPVAGGNEHFAMAAGPLAETLPALSEPKPPQAAASLWEGGPRSLLGDRRASDRGDIVTVVISIDERAEFENSSDRSRRGSESMAVPGLFGLPQSLDRRLPEGASSAEAVDLEGRARYAGEGAISRRERLALRVAATVVEVLPNGALRIEGRQEVRLNFELRELMVSGYVRPEDISRRNEITYDKIASARISYGGRGQITDVQQPRYGQQIADIILPF